VGGDIYNLELTIGNSKLRSKNNINNLAFKMTNTLWTYPSLSVEKNIFCVYFLAIESKHIFRILKWGGYFNFYLNIT